MHFIYSGIRVRDLERSKRFYVKGLGMRVVNQSRMEAGGIYVQMKSPGSRQILELNWYPRGSPFYESYAKGSELDHLGFWCQDVRADFERLIEAGAAKAVEPWEEDKWTLAFVKDPDGIWIELLGRRTASKARIPPKRRKRPARRT